MEMHIRESSVFGLWSLVSRVLFASLVGGLAIIVTACSGGLSVTPTSPTPASPGSGAPLTLSFRGTLADGGSFTGTVTYGANDQDEREDVGRFRGGSWNVVVTGGSSTKDVTLSDASGGRAALETTNTPSPTIGVIFLWPQEDPKVQELSPHFRAMPGYDPDMQPRPSHFGELLPGSLASGFGLFRDGQGGQVLVSSMQFVTSFRDPGAGIRSLFTLP